MIEKEIAMMEGMICYLSDEYFKARPQLDNLHNRRIFEAGAERMYKLLAKREDENS